MSSRNPKPLLLWATPLLLVVLAGCGGGGPKLVKVSGTLTYKGKPVTNASLDFMPEHGRPSWGKTDEAGRFTLSYDRTREGAIVGKHKVMIKMRPTLDTVAEQQAVMMGRRPPMSPEMATFFDKYSPQKSKLEVQIDDNTKDLKLDLD
jgi:hypothetical protein